MVVGAGEGHQPSIGFAADRPGRNDGALAGHEPRYRRHRSNRARVGERDRGPLIRIRKQLVGAGTGDQAFVFFVKRPKRHGVDLLDHRYHQAPPPVLPLDVYRQSQVYGARIVLVWATLSLHHGPNHRWEPLGGQHDCPADQVRE